MRGPVICGVDDWTRDAAAVHVARDLAERFGLPLLFVHVLEPGRVRRTGNGASPLPDPADRPLAPDASWAIASGHPADRLVALAEEHGASFIVLGSHGPRSSLLGSVSAEVSRRAPCPVVVVPPNATRSVERRHGARTVPVGVASA